MLQGVEQPGPQLIDRQIDEVPRQFVHDMALCRLRQVIAHFGQKPWCGDQHDTAPLPVVCRERNPLGQLLGKPLRSMLFVRLLGLQRGPPAACAAASRTGAKHHMSRCVGTEVGVVACGEFILQCLERPQYSFGSAEFEHLGVSRIGDHDGQRGHGLGPRGSLGAHCAARVEASLRRPPS